VRLPMTHANVYSLLADSVSGFLFVVMNSRLQRPIRTSTACTRSDNKLLEAKICGFERRNVVLSLGKTSVFLNWIVKLLEKILQEWYMNSNAI